MDTELPLEPTPEELSLERELEEVQAKAALIQQRLAAKRVARLEAKPKLPEPSKLAPISDYVWWAVYGMLTCAEIIACMMCSKQQYKIGKSTRWWNNFTYNIKLHESGTSGRGDGAQRHTYKDSDKQRWSLYRIPAKTLKITRQPKVTHRDDGTISSSSWEHPSNHKRWSTFWAALPDMLLGNMFGNLACVTLNEIPLTPELATAFCTRPLKILNIVADVLSNIEREGGNPVENLEWIRSVLLHPNCQIEHLFISACRPGNNLFPGEQPPGLLYGTILSLSTYAGLKTLRVKTAYSGFGADLEVLPMLQHAVTTNSGLESVSLIGNFRWRESDTPLLQHLFTAGSIRHLELGSCNTTVVITPQMLEHCTLKSLKISSMVGMHYNFPESFVSFGQLRCLKLSIITQDMESMESLLFKFPATALCKLEQLCITCPNSLNTKMLTEALVGSESLKKVCLNFRDNLLVQQLDPGCRADAIQTVVRYMLGSPQLERLHIPAFTLRYPGYEYRYRMTKQILNWLQKRLPSALTHAGYKGSCKLTWASQVSQTITRTLPCRCH
jgi:hypothetical protein